MDDKPNLSDADYRRVIDEIESINEEIDSEKALAKEKIDKLRLEVRDAINEYEAKGFDPKAIRAKIKERALHRKADGIEATLDTAAQAQFRRFGEALGEYADTPLGAAALERERANLHELGAEIE